MGCMYWYILRSPLIISEVAMIGCLLRVSQILAGSSNQTVCQETSHQITTDHIALYRCTSHQRRISPDRIGMLLNDPYTNCVIVKDAVSFLFYFYP